MDVIDIFLVIFTVVLFCSWGYIVWANWKGKNYIIKFPPYGLDTCPIGYILTNEDSTKCNPKHQLTKINTSQLTPIDSNKSKDLCQFVTTHLDKQSTLWDGVPNKYTHLNATSSKVRKLLKNCCNPDGSTTCDLDDFATFMGSSDYDAQGEDKDQQCKRRFSFF